MRKFAFVLLVVAVSSCSFFKKKKVVDKDAIARVSDDYLYASDIPAITKGLTGKDSIGALKDYAQNWVRKKLLLQKAEENIPDDDAGIARKVEDYRESLFLYEYEKALISKRLDTTISENEMQAQYEKLKTAFPLQSDVYQLYFIKLKKDAPDLDNARKWILKPHDEEDTRKLEGYCREYASGAAINNGVWFEKDNVLKNFPLTEGDIALLIATKSYKEFKDHDVIWFIKVSDMAKAGQPAPLDFIRDDLEKAITEKRRLELIERIYDKIYQDGIKSKSFEILNKVRRVMKHILPVWVLVAILWIGNANLYAQTDRGGYLAGGSADMSDDFNGTNRNFNFSVSPSFGVFVVKGFAIGGNYAITIGNARTYDASSGTYSSITSLQTFVGPYLKYYIGKKQLKGMISFTGGYSGYTELGGGDVISLNGFALQGMVGMAYFFNEHISLETAGYINAQGYQTLLPNTRVGLSVGFFTFLDKKKQE